MYRDNRKKYSATHTWQPPTKLLLINGWSKGSVRVQFHADFWKMLEIRMLAPPPTENTGSALLIVIPLQLRLLLPHLLVHPPLNTIPATDLLILSIGADNNHHQSNSSHECFNSENDQLLPYILVGHYNSTANNHYLQTVMHFIRKYAIHLIETQRNHLIKSKN